MDIVQDADNASAAQNETKKEASVDASGGDNIMNAAPTPTYIPSSPPPGPTDMSPDLENGEASPTGAKSDSEAETVLLPGVDGYSPSKSRKVKLEDRSDENGALNEIDAKRINTEHTIHEEQKDDGEGSASPLGKRKRSKHATNGAKDRHRTGNSSGLSSVPTSPLITRRPSSPKSAGSDSDTSDSASHQRQKKAKPYAGTAPSIEREGAAQEDKEKRAIRKQYGLGAEGGGAQKQARASQSTPNHSDNVQDRTRSTSPASNGNRRSVSTQPPGASSSGPGAKKKRVPAPLRTTKDRLSHDSQSEDENSTGESAQPRRSRTRNLATPPTGDSSASLVKMGKKRRQYGLTPLASACEHGELRKAQEELDENPEDLDTPDNAGNTPLQVAALNGHADLCRFLIKAGCDIHCSNLNKESPLLDAAENGHLDVVKVLLTAGVNPRTRNVLGEEPIDKVDEDADDADAIKRALLAARKTYNPPQSTSQIKPPPPKAPDANSSRNSRFTSHSRARTTDQGQLFTQLDVRNLRAKAAIGDVTTVMRILEVLGERGGDTEALVNAAKGGHEEVVGFLMALGGADPDPEPLENKDRDHATPMLAAIGGDNTKVIETLLGSIDDGKFNPTRKHDGKTYFDIAKERRGSCWQEEEKILKQAYNKFDRTKISSKSRRSGASSQSASKSSARKDTDATDSGTPLKREHPRNEGGIKRDRTQLGAIDPSAKRGPGRPRREARDGSQSPDRETPRTKTSSHKTDPDTMSTVSDSERSKPRRKLVSGRDLKGDRQRRSSFTSVKSTMLAQERADIEERVKDESKPLEGAKARQSSHSNGSRALDKTLDRARSLKRDGSKDRLSAIRGSSPNKKPLKSPTPSVDAQTSSHTVDAGKSQKRRRAETDSSSRTDARNSRSPERKMASTKDKAPTQRDISPDTQRINKRPKLHNGDSQDDEHHVSRPIDSNLEPKDSKTSVPTSTNKLSPDREEESRVAREKREAEKVEIEERAKREVEKLAKIQAEEAKRAEAAKEAEEKRSREEAIEREKAKALQLEREIAAAKAEEIARRLQKERQEREEREAMEQQAKEEAERKRLEAERQQKRIEQAERKKAEFEAAQKAERQRLFQEQESLRLAKLPPLLRWFDQCPEADKLEYAKRRKSLWGMRYDSIVPDSAVGTQSTEQGREQWVLNAQVALLLGERDLQLSRYTAWERLGASHIAKQTLWNLLAVDFAVVREDLQKFIRGPDNMLSFPQVCEATEQALPLWFSLDLFFVKVSEVMFIINKFPHLHNVEITVEYNELPLPQYFNKQDSAAQAAKRWRRDPNAHPMFPPGEKVYVNGSLVREAATNVRIYDTPVSDKPFPPSNLPTLAGVRQINRGHPLFVQLCIEQGKHHLLNDEERAKNGMTPPDSTASAEGVRRSSAASSTRSVVGGLSNGIDTK